MRESDKRFESTDTKSSLGPEYTRKKSIQAGIMVQRPRKRNPQTPVSERSINTEMTVASLLTNPLAY